jgi:hypothetical protein
MTFKNNKKAPEKNAPAFAAFHVRPAKDDKGGEGGKGFWTRIGAAWAHEDGEGLNLQIDMVPLDGKIVLRTPKPDDEAK